MIPSNPFIIYGDFNCPFCYALNERLHILGISSQIDWRPVEHDPLVNSHQVSFESLSELTSEVIEVRRRAPSAEIITPAFRPNSAMASRIVVAVTRQDPLKAAALRRLLYRALWVDGQDISNPEVIEELTTSAGIHGFSIDPSIQKRMHAWQQEWETADYDRSIPVIIDDEGATVVGFPEQAQLDAFLTHQHEQIVTDSGSACVMRPRQRILMLEQDPDNIQLLIREMRQCEVAIADNYDQLAEAIEGDKAPDLIIADMDTLGSEGLEKCRHMRSTLADSAIGVVMTNHDESSVAEAQAFAAGASDFIRKPFHPAVLKARLETQLEILRSRMVLEKMARFDTLTEVFNRREFDLKLQMEWDRGARSHEPLSLLMIDIDLFKDYNDHYGHTQGDDCLRTVAALLRDGLHRPSDLLARYGGEEFVCVLPDTSSEGATHVAQRCLRLVEAAHIPHDHSDVAPWVTISIGVVTVTVDNSRHCEQLIDLADKALYQAKHDGRNRLVVNTTD